MTPTSTRPFRIVPPAPPPAPILPEVAAVVERGRLLNANDIAREFSSGRKNARWVKMHLKSMRAALPGRPTWWERDVCTYFGVPFPRPR